MSVIQLTQGTFSEPPSLLQSIERTTCALTFQLSFPVTFKDNFACIVFFFYNSLYSGSPGLKEEE